MFGRHGLFHRLALLVFHTVFRLAHFVASVCADVASRLEGKRTRAAQGRGAPPAPPSTVAVVYNDAADHWDATAASVAHVLAWAKAEGAKRVVLYEPTGALSQDVGAVETAAAAALAGTPHCVRVGRSSEGCPGPEPVRHARSGTGGAAVTIDVVSYRAGLYPLLLSADAQHELEDSPAGPDSEAIDPGGSRAADPSPEALQARIEDKWPGCLYKADLLVVVGAACSVAGYPPLGLGRCELLHVGPAQGLTQAKLRDAALRYRAVRQRFGT